MKIPSLDPAAAGYADALRAVERALDDTRGAWDDSARKNFDSRYADRVVADAKKTSNDLKRLAQELAAAAHLLDSSG